MQSLHCVSIRLIWQLYPWISCVASTADSPPYNSAICTWDRSQGPGHCWGGLTPLARGKACEFPWVLMACAADIRRAAWIGVLTNGATDGLWAIAEHTDSWRYWRASGGQWTAKCTVHWRLARLTLSRPDWANWPKTRERSNWRERRLTGRRPVSWLTGRRRGNERPTGRRLENKATCYDPMRGDHELETDDSAADANRWQEGPRPGRTAWAEWPSRTQPWTGRATMTQASRCRRAGGWDHGDASDWHWTWLRRLRTQTRMTGARQATEQTTWRATQH